MSTPPADPDLSVSVAAAIDPQLPSTIYEDLRGIVQQAGKLGEDVVKTARLLLCPLQFGAAYQDRVAAFCKRISEKVPAERRVQPPTEIAGPVLEQLRFAQPDSTLTEMCLNLLSRAMDRDRAAEAHPAFVQILRELAPDEAVLLFFLHKGMGWYQIGRSTLVTEGGHATVVRNYESAKLKPTLAKHLNAPRCFKIYRHHLQVLGLLDEAPESKRTYLGVTQTMRDVDKAWIRGNARLTLFGQEFCRACMPERLPDPPDRS